MRRSRRPCWRPTQYNAAAQETEEIDYSGSTKNNYETDQITYNVSSGLETFEGDFNSKGQETEIQTYSGS